MKKTILLFNSIIILMLSLSQYILFAGENIKAKSNEGVFNIGEKLKYRLSWQFVQGGYATLEVRNIEKLNNNNCYHIVSEVRTTETFDNVFKVRDVYESWFDVKTGISRKYSSRVSEGNFKGNETILFDQNKHTFNIVEAKKSGKIPSSVQDAISTVYHIRVKELMVGKSYDVDSHLGDTTWPIRIFVYRKERIKVPAGEYDCVVIRPMLRKIVGDKSISQGSIEVWFTNDNKKIPVKISCKIPLGSIIAELVEY